jgi:hypothetical protein
MNLGFLRKSRNSSRGGSKQAFSSEGALQVVQMSLIASRLWARWRAKLASLEGA